MTSSIKNYLPSKKFIISVSILAGIVVLITLGKWIINRSSKNIDPAKVRVTNLLNPAEIDTDGDGVFDWEEALWGTDPRNPDSNADGIPDGVEIARRRELLAIENGGTLELFDEENLSQTDKLARDIYTAISVAAQNGLTEEKNLELQNDIAKALVNINPSTKKYTRTSFSETANTDVFVTRYATAITNFFTKNKNVLDKIYTTTEAVQTNTINQTLFEQAGNELIRISEDLTTIPVPGGILSTHTGLANSLHSLGTIIIGLSKIEEDPVVALSFGIEHRDVLIDYSTALANLKLYFEALAR